MGTLKEIKENSYIGLEKFIEIEKLKNVDFIKLDVDGKELEILEGAENILSGINSILVEMEGINLDENLEKIENILAMAGLEEELSWRNKGSRRNRLYLRKYSNE